MIDITTLTTEQREKAIALYMDEGFWLVCYRDAYYQHKPYWLTRYMTKEAGQTALDDQMIKYPQWGTAQYNVVYFAPKYHLFYNLIMPVWSKISGSARDGKMRGRSCMLIIDNKEYSGIGETLLQAIFNCVSDYCIAWCIQHDKSLDE